MPIRYFKCHTRPYPSVFTPTTDWEVTSLGGGRMSVELGYRHGPPGQDPPTAITTQIEWAALGATAATSVATQASSISDVGYRFEDIAEVNTVFRVRRVNSAGAGEWSATTLLEV